jgi:secreted Zn-dependent insulinase-like peptidase
MYAIKNKENFTQEVVGLIEKIKHQIGLYSDAVNVGSALSTNDTIEKINVLKKYDLLLKQLPTQLAEMNQEDWETKKEGLQNTFHQATDSLNSIVKKVA